MQYRSSRVWISGILISLVYWATWHGYHDNPKYHFSTNPYIRHSLNFSLLLLVALVGWHGWRYHRQIWIKKLWVIIYVSIITFLLICGAFDLLFRFENMSTRSLLSGLRLFFTSPVPFGVLIFLSRLSRKA
jgi:magnesium-transporting ATPase (P-type)